MFTNSYVMLFILSVATYTGTFSTEVLLMNLFK